jgi:hypothetical protein
MKTIRQRLLDKIDIRGQDECWPWTGAVNRSNRGQFSISGRTVSAPRAVLEFLAGQDVPSHLYALHNCDNPNCVNPDHLWLGTQQDNMDDMRDKGRERVHSTHCPSGHRYTKDNTAWRRAGNSNNRQVRRCRTCSREQSKRSYEKHKEKRQAEGRDYYHRRGKMLRKYR